MAKHIYNDILEKILTKTKHHRTIDLVFALIDLSKQIKTGKEKTNYKFIVPCFNDSPHSLWNEVDTKFPNLINKTTIYDCVKELKELEIIKFNNELEGYELINMEKMLNKKDKGYTDIRPFFFTKSFIKMPYIEKRALVYMLHLLDKKTSSKIFKNDYGVDIVCNLNNYRKSFNKNELNWMTVCRTSNIYYVKRIFNSLATNYLDIIESKTNEFRKIKYGKQKGISKGVCVDVIFFFNLKNNLKDKDYNEDLEIEILSEKFPDLRKIIDNTCEKQNVKISSQSKLALLRRLYKFLPFAQENIISKIVSRIEKSKHSRYLVIRNIEAFVQHIVNTNPLLKKSTNTKPYERGILDIVI